ncbi:MAG: hypothetical protein LBJ24_01950 [Treponema sp.]|jgi:hypothetical protein|nr:hypothetical protein [Treponema sp.]
MQDGESPKPKPESMQDLVFYYSREKRLERASSALRAFVNDSGPPPRRGLFRTLAANKSQAMVFFSIIIISAVMILTSLFHASRDEVLLEGNALTVSALRYQGSTILVIKKELKNQKNPYAGAVDVGVSPALSRGEQAAGAEVPVFARRIFFTLEKNEEYRISVPFEGDELLLLFQAEERRVTLRVKPE